MIEENSRSNLKLVLAPMLIVILVLAWFVYEYNQLVLKDERVKKSWSQVESNIQRKADLLPNLVRVVKSYAKHEKEVFESVAKIRSNIGGKTGSHAPPTEEGIKKLAQMDKQMNIGISKLLAVSEKYPELRSSDQFLQLQSQIEGSENRVNITRMNFNEDVGDFNAYKRSLPANIVSSVAGFNRKAYFEADESAKKKYEIDI